MITLATPWWRDRSPREQRLLAVLALLLLGLGLWFGVWRPLAAGRAASAARHSAAVTALADVERMGVAIRAAEARARSAQAQPIIARIGARAAAAGITVTSLDAAGAGTARLVIAAVRPQPLLAFVAGLERDDGLVIDSLNITRNDDASVAAEINLRTPA
jgi:general secretion pathway protein M